MNRRTSAIFNILELNPSEEFYIVGQDNYKYRITEDMILQRSLDSTHWENDSTYLTDILTSKVRTVKFYTDWLIQSFVKRRLVERR